MVHKPMLCKLLVFCSRTTIVGVWIDADTATWGEDTRHLYIFRIHEADKVFHDDIEVRNSFTRKTNNPHIK